MARVSRSPVDQLIADLSSSDPIRRDAAVARLRVLGARAVPRLAALIESDAPPASRVLALAALEGAAPLHAADLAMTCLDSPDADIVVAALGVLRGWVTQETGTRVLEAVTAVALDQSRDARVRLAAMEALADLPAELLDPIRGQTPSPESAGPMLDDPGAAHAWVDAHGRTATLSTLHDAVKAFREHESAAGSRRAAEEWVQARGAVHAALAARGSRVALYDVKESLATAQAALPPGFLDAIHSVGDASCLEPLARAWSATVHDGPWRSQLQEVAQAIVRRSKLTGRSAVLKGIRENWKGFL